MRTLGDFSGFLSILGFAANVLSQGHNGSMLNNDVSVLIPASNKSKVTILQPDLVMDQNGGKTEVKQPFHQGMKQECHLHPLDQDLPNRIQWLKEKGIKLFRYNITLHDYNRELLINTMNNTLTPELWYLTVSSQAQSQLLFGLRFDVLSLGTLSASMEDIKVPVLDAPSGCLPEQSEEKLLSIISLAVLRDFTDEGEQAIELNDDTSACRRSVLVEDEMLRFPLSCCSTDKYRKTLTCVEDVKNDWITVLHIITIFMKLFFFLFGPYYITKLYYSGALNESPYVVPLRDKIRKTLMVKKVRMPPDPNPNHGSEDRDNKPKRLKEFGEMVKNLPGDEVIHAKFNKLQIVVDQKKLMAHGELPFGICSYIYQTFLRCRLSNKATFAPCCRQSLFGSWSPYFLWIPLRKGSHDCNESCKSVFPWAFLIRIFGSLLLMAIIPLPFYIRLIIFSVYESDHSQSMEDAAERTDLPIYPNHDFIRSFGPRHAIFVAVYTVYIMCFVFLSLIRACNTEIFDKYIYQVIEDFRNIKHRKTISLLASHLLLPFEKFGFLCGLLAACVYWPLVLPVCLLIIIVYNIPLIYLCGRLLFKSRPAVCKCIPLKQRRGNLPPETISDGVSSIESCCMLNEISGPRDQLEDDQFPCRCTKVQICSLVRGFLIGSFCSLLLISSMFMLAECLTYSMETLVVTLIGAIINANRVVKYAIIILWILTYFFVTYTQFRLKYLKFSRDLFRFLQRKFSEELKLSSRFRREGMSTCFKMSSKFPPKGSKHELFSESESNTNDTVEYVEGVLFWKLHGVALFVDEQDNARIPHSLFKRLCHESFTGSPGSILCNILATLRRFVYSSLFAVLVFIGIMALREDHETVSTQEIIVLLVAGAVPLVLLLTIPDRKRMQDFSFEGLVSDVIRNFEQEFPLYDLCFGISQTRDSIGGTVFSGTTEIPRNTTGASQSEGDIHKTSALGNRSMSDRSLGRFKGQFERESTESAIAVEPTHIDLLLTVRDESSEDQIANIRSDAESPNSRGFRLSNRMTQTSSDRVALVDNPDGDYASGATASFALAPLNSGHSSKTKRTPSPAVMRAGSLNSSGTSPDKDTKSDIRSIGPDNRSDIRSLTSQSRHNTPPTALYSAGVTGIMADCVVDLVGGQAVTSLDNINRALRKDEEAASVNQKQRKTCDDDLASNANV